MNIKEMLKLNLKLKSERGVIAIVTVLIMSAVLLIVSIGVNSSQISTSDQYLNSYSNKIVYYVAESCLEEALVQLERDPSYIGAMMIVEGFVNTTCDISLSGTTEKSILITVDYYDYSQTFNAILTLTTNGWANNARLSDWTKFY